MHQHHDHKKKTALQVETVITHTCMDNKTPKLVCDFLKPLAVIYMNPAFPVVQVTSSISSRAGGTSFYCFLVTTLFSEESDDAIPTYGCCACSLAKITPLGFFSNVQGAAMAY